MGKGERVVVQSATSEAKQPSSNQPVQVSPIGLQGLLGVPAGATSLVVFAHGSGSSRLSPRNGYVAEALRAAGHGTLLLDLLTEHEARDRACVFDIELLATRLVMAIEWARGEARTRGLTIGYFGASTGAGAALVADSLAGGSVAAVVSRGGRPDLAGDALQRVTAPTRLVVGSLDVGVLELNEAAFARLRCERDLQIVPGASHLFEEPGTLDQVIGHACDWFDRHLKK